MKTDPQVTCITIFLNAEKFIVEAVESVFAQTYPHWELLLVDDGSTDGSTAFARQLAEEYPEKVRYLEHEGHLNQGMSASRNLGVQNSRGEFIAFLDADDIWLPTKIEEQVEILESYPQAAMVYGRTLIWHSWTGEPEDMNCDFTYPLGVQPGAVIYPPALLLILVENKFQTPTTCNAIIRRETCLEVGGFVERFRGMYEDQVFFSKILLKKPVFVAENCWARYRQRSPKAKAFAGLDTRYCSDRRPFLQWLSAYLEEENIAPGTEVWKALENEIRKCRYPFLFILQQILWTLIEMGKSLLKRLAGSSRSRLLDQ